VGSAGADLQVQLDGPPARIRRGSRHGVSAGAPPATGHPGFSWTELGGTDAAVPESPSVHSPLKSFKKYCAKLRATVKLKRAASALRTKPRKISSCHEELPRSPKQASAHRTTSTSTLPQRSQMESGDAACLRIESAAPDGHFFTQSTPPAPAPVDYYKWWPEKSVDSTRTTASENLSRRGCRDCASIKNAITA